MAGLRLAPIQSRGEGRLARRGAWTAAPSAWILGPELTVDQTPKTMRLQRDPQSAEGPSVWHSASMRKRRDSGQKNSTAVFGP
eukprot:3817522-Alexandrium_andersonii.AAC.1